MKSASGLKKARHKMTSIEYFETPETTLPRELAYGVMRVADAPSTLHQRVVRELVLALSAFVRQRRAGEILFAPLDVVLDFDAALVVQPDIVYVSRERSHMLTDRLYGPPDLAVEVLSPHARVGRLEEQIGWFAKYGVRECWLADVKRHEIAVLTLDKTGVVARTLHSETSPVESRVLPDVGVTPLQVFGY